MGLEVEVECFDPGRRSFLGAATVALAGSGLSLAAPEGTPSAAQPGQGPIAAPSRDTLEMKIQRLSWAGLKIEVGKTTVLIDPLLDPAQLSPGETYAPIQTSTELRYALVTHQHADHYDPPTIKAHLSEKGYVLCHPLMAPMAAGDGLRVRGAAFYDPIVLRGSDVCVVAVDAVDGPGDPQVSWIVSGAGRRIIHCGDTLWHGYWWKLGMAYGPFDAAFLPINGAIIQTRTPPSGLPASMTPEQAVAAADILNAKLLCPIHYGVNEPPSYVEFPDVERAVREAAQTRRVNLSLVQPGDWVSLPPRLRD